ncbi:MAG TPA: ATP-binding protein [Chloroflexota bacterium]|jgi:two-component system chemotaxis sensor kinase CheA|nr:ATP-binding protein [Chloroflexota bacterium]
MQDRQRRLLELFRAEARESLSVLTAGALQIEQGAGATELIAAMYRAAHTVKGGARLLGLDAVGAVAERAETVMRALRDGALPPGREPGGQLLEAIDELTGLIWSDPPPSATAPAPEPTRAESAPAESAPAGGAPAEDPRAGARVRSIRIPSDRIDAVVGLASEARRAAETLADATGGPEARALAGLLATAEAAALRLRLVPLEGIFADLRLAARNVALADGKEAVLLTRGGEVEADSAVVDAAAEIVLQLVRNAVAHGIEPPDERAAGGKPRAGRIELAVHARGGWLELTVADDGHGVDEPALRARARERGLPEGLPTEELLFAPGVSTRRQADQLGGEGVGLDVVRARAAAAGGEVSVRWSAGAGTSFVVRLPVTALYERLAVAELGGTPIGVPADEVASIELAAASGGGAPSTLDSQPSTLALDGPVDEVSVLTVPLGPLFGPNRFFKRAWITADGRVGVVLEPSALA